MGTSDQDHERLAGEWIDAALKQYGKAEPRPGLEARVLASLRVEKENVHDRTPWWAALGVVTAVAVVAATIFLARGHGVVPEPAGPSTAVSAPQIEATTSPGLAASAAVTLPTSSRGIRRTAHPRPARSAARAAEDEPRLAQFPSPRPLSEQEKMLVRYVLENTEHAKLVARVQGVSLQEDLREFANPPDLARPSQGSEQ